LLHDHLVLINDLVVHVQHKVVAEDLAALLRAAVHIVHNLVAVNVLVALVLVVPDNVLAQVAHLEKMLERKRVTNLRRLVAKRSTTWRHRHSVALLFLAVTERLQFGFVAVRRLLISPKKLAQIPQR
jgi:hypothetical protein